MLLLSHCESLPDGTHDERKLESQTAAISGAMCEDEVLLSCLLDKLLQLILGEDVFQARVTHLVLNGVQKLLVQRL